MPEIPTDQEKIEIRLKYVEEGIHELNTLNRNMSQELSDLRVSVERTLGEINTNISVMSNEMKHLRKDFTKENEDIRKEIDDQEVRIRNTEGFKGKVIGIGVAASVVLGMIGSAIFNSIFGK